MTAARYAMALLGALVCGPVGTAQAFVSLANTGAPSASVVGAAKVFDPPAFDEQDSYVHSTVGTDFLDGFTSDGVSGSTSLGGGTVISTASGSYTMTLVFSRPGSTFDLMGGSMMFSADSSILLSPDVATDAGDDALTRAYAGTRTSLVFGI